ncbi:MAG: hypothetical protein HYR59_00320 [Acidobacteria bacterium]|nr:hypothetical protein [Acidobacteriota bacterium]
MLQNRQGRTHNLEIWTLALGVMAGYVGVRGLLLWDALAPATRGYYLLSLIAGTPVAVCGAVLLARRTDPRVILRWGMAAAGILAVSQALGLVLKIIPCSGPG